MNKTIKIVVVGLLTLAGLVAALAYTASALADHKAHRIVMDEHSRDAAWVHAYLHRVEGDDGNAGYWYRQAKREPATVPPDTEWEAIVSALL